MRKTRVGGAFRSSEHLARWAGLRPGLLASAAFPLLALAASPASAGCTTPDTVPVVTCTGDLSGGVSVSNSVTTKLEIKQVTTNIAPAAGKDGINFVPTNPFIPLAELRSDLSKSPGSPDRFSIIVSGAEADGVNARSSNQALLVDSTGNITVTSKLGARINNGISADIEPTFAGTFDNKVYSKGDISVLTPNPVSYGIKANAGNGPVKIAGAIRVESTGNITATAGTGILAGDNAVSPNMAVTADITVISRGNITVGSDGIVAATGKGSISITSEGNIVSGRLGINADCGNCSGDVTVLNTGDITITGDKTNSSISAQTKGKTRVISTGALSRGIRAGGGLDAYVSNNGTVSAYGLSASSSFGKAEIRSQGDVTDPVVANGNQGASVENKGNIVNAGSSSLAAYTTWGRAVITNTDSRSSFINSGEIGITGGVLNDATIEITNGARIEAYYRGIATYSHEGLTKVTNTGVIEATEFSGIRLYSFSRGSLQLMNSAAVTGGTSGIILQTKSGDVIIEQTGGAVTAEKTPVEDEKLPLICIQNGGAAICATTGETGTVNVTAENGVFAPTTGVFARTGQGALTVAITGGIAGAGGKANATKGIDAISTSGDVAVTSIGNIAVYDTGINATSTSGKVTVSSTGNVTSLNGAGIAAAGSAAAEVNITSDGLVQSRLTGIEGSASDGKLSIVSKGAVTSSDGKGILAQSTGLGLVDVKSDAAVTGGDSGIFATAATTNVSVAQKGGAVTATGGLAGIYAKTGGTGVVTVTADSSILSAVAGVVARTDQGALTVSVTGGIAGAGGKANATKGIDAVSASGDVAVTSIGNIAVYDTGINAASTSGKVTVSSTGNVTSLNGAGIAARGGAAPVTVSAQGDVSSSLNSAIVVEGLGALSVKATGVTQGAIAGVEFGDAAPGLDGTANSLEIAATANVRNTSADLAKLAIWGRAGAETVVNSGTVIGSVDLGGGSDSFVNKTGALFITGTQVMLGAGETLTNEGNLNIGGGANLFKTNLTGNVSQSADGVFYVDFKPDSAPAKRASDVLVLTGNANLSGTVVASQWAGTKVNAEQQFVILETSGGVVTASGLALSIAPTPGYVASLEVLNNGTQLVLKFTAVDPGPQPEPPTEIVPDWAVAAALSALNFSDTLIGCPRDSGSYAAIGEGQCLWMDSGGGYLDSDAANGNPGWDQTSWWIGGGGQVALSDVIRLGASVRYEDSSLDSGENASTSGALWNAGAALTYTSGPVLLAAAASAGWSTLDTHRETSAGGKVTADHDLGYAHAKLRAGYLLEYGQWYLKPLIDLDATWMSYGDFSEKGAGAVKADSEDKTLLSASPRLEIGGDIELENGALLRPFLRAGATVFDDTGFGLGWRYVAGPSDAPAYQARAELDQVMADVSAGFDIFGMNGLSARVYYDGSFGETIHSHAGGFTARLEF